jgi:hypothetical protein
MNMRERAIGLLKEMDWHFNSIPVGASFEIIFELPEGREIHKFRMEELELGEQKVKKVFHYESHSHREVLEALGFFRQTTEFHKECLLRYQN